MFAQFNFGDPSERVRDAIGDYLETRLDEIPGIEVVGRLTGWGLGRRGHRRTVPGAVGLGAGHPAAWCDCPGGCRGVRPAAANQFNQDAVAVLYG